MASGVLDVSKSHGECVCISTNRQVKVSCMNDLLPNTIVLTVPKTGSTSLYATFDNHPSICLPTSKETWFFTTYWEKGVQWYEDKFSHCSGKKVRCDFVSTLMYEEGFTEKLKQVVPEAKFIVLLRDPIERCISHYFHEVRRGFEKECFERAMAMEKDRIKSNPQRYTHIAYRDIGALYKSRIRELLDTFRRERIKIVLLEELISSSNNLSSLWKFLEVQPLVNELSRENVARLPYNRITEKLLSVPGEVFCSLQQSWLLQVFVPQTVKRNTRIIRGKIAHLLSSIRELAYKESEKPDIPQNIRDELAKYYDETLDGLDKIIGKNLSVFWPWYGD